MTMYPWSSDPRTKRLQAERDRLREALESIIVEYEGHMGTGQMLTEFCRAALAVGKSPATFRPAPGYGRVPEIGLGQGEADV